MVAALISLASVLVLGLTVASLMKTETAATKNFCDGIAAQAVAEAGLRRAIVVLYKNGEPNGLSESLTGDPDWGLYQVSTQAEGTRLRIRSTGRVGEARRICSALLAVEWSSATGQGDRQIQILSYSN